MAYTDTDAVNGALGPHAATGNTTPTITQLSAMIEGINSQIDTCLKSVGVASVPVTSAVDSTFATFLAEVNKWGAMAEFLKAMFPEATGPGENPAFAFWQRKYDDVIKGWKDPDGPFGLPTGLLGDPGDADPSTYFTRNPNEEEVLGDLQESMNVTRFGDTF